MNYTSTPTDVDPVTATVVRALRHPIISRLIMVVDPLLQHFRIDLISLRGGPKRGALMLATAAAVTGSLLADAGIVAVAGRLFPSIAQYPHFQFLDYARLTVVGVLIACAGWGIIPHFATDPRWLFSRIAVLTTLVLFLPDVYILMFGAPFLAVLVLMAMHIAIAYVTYYALVVLAPPVRPPDTLDLEGSSSYFIMDKIQ